MPGLDGPKLYEAIQKRQGEDLPRVIFMTGNAALSADFLLGVQRRRRPRR
jgi:hypothetical protein